ncbi:MAG: 50S ribosomal protein L11 methyltransferase [Dictyoglomus turgidum]
MEYFELMFKTAKELEEPIVAILEDVDSIGIAIEDNFFDESILWDYIDKSFSERNYILIKAYFDRNVDIDKIIDKIRTKIKEIFGEAKVEIEYRIIREEDWTNKWKKYAKPIYLDRIVVLPSWEEIGNVEDRILIRIDPGMAFGTGNHPTTIMCIEMLQKYLKEGMDVLDVGTGSGILSIVAKKLGGDKVKGVDIDEKAIEVAKKNAEGNHVEVEFQKNDLIDGINEKYDIVVANLIAEIILKLNANVKRVLKTDGIYIVSGIVQEKLDMILNSLRESGFKLLEVKEKEDWYTVVAQNED